MTTEHENDRLALEQDIRKHLTIAMDDQVQRFADQIELMKEIDTYFHAYGEDLSTPGIQAHLQNARDKFDYQHPFQIVVIGVSGAGKSSLINALLGGTFAPVGNLGGAVTGTALQFFFDDQRAGQVEVIYRDEQNIRSLIAGYLLTQAGLNSIQLPPQLDDQFSQFLRDLPTNTPLKEAFAEMVDQYLKFLRGNNPKRYFDLSNPDEANLVTGLISEREKSEWPTSLVTSVRYYVAANRPANQHDYVSLPDNCCLVDLPGAGGKPLHDVIIKEGIKAADAVIFVARPRQGHEKDEQILAEVRKYVTLGAVNATDRVFLVINSWDTIPVDEPTKLPEFQQFTKDLIKLVTNNPIEEMPNRNGAPPYFLTTAALASLAQQALYGKPLTQPLVYETLSRRLKVTIPQNINDADHRLLLEASKIPELISQLNQFARERLISRQIEDGSASQTWVIDTLIKEHTRNRSGQGSSYVTEQRVKVLRENQHASEKAIRRFSYRQLNDRDTLKGRLQEQADHISNTIDETLRRQLPELWKDHFSESVYLRFDIDFGQPKREQLIGQVEALLWQQLIDRMPALADLLASNYQQVVEEERIAPYLRAQCFEHHLGEDLIDWLTEQTNEENNHGIKAILTKLSDRIALAQLLDPQYSFLPLQQIQNRTYGENPIYQSLIQVPNQEEVSAEHFDAFITSVRQHYSVHVREWSIDRLLNLYEHEVLRVQQEAHQRIRQLFHELHRSNEPILNERIASSIPGIDQVERLERKLVALTALHKRAHQPAVVAETA